MQLTPVTGTQVTGQSSAHPGSIAWTQPGTSQRPPVTGLAAEQSAVPPRHAQPVGRPQTGGSLAHAPAIGPQLYICGCVQSAHAPMGKQSGQQ